MKKLFLTQEIGSLQRPIWRQKLDAPASKAWVNDAIVWGERLGVEERFELANPQGKGILQKDGKTRSVEEKRRIIDIASIYAIRLLELAGLDRVFNGEQPRTEMYDFLAINTDGIEAAGVLNAFDANYFKKGVVAGPLSIKPQGLSFFVEELGFVKRNSRKTAKPCLTGPYTMADWSYIEHHRKLLEEKGEPSQQVISGARRDAVLDFAKNVLNPIVRELAKEVEVVQIDEPAASTNEQESALFVEAINACFEGVPSSVEKAVHLCYSDYPALFPALADCVADSYLIEFTNHASPTSFKPDQVSPETFRALELFKEYGLKANVGVGVLDIHSDLIETPGVVRDRLLYAAKVLGDPARIQANPDCGLRTRQWHVAFAKLCNMCEGAALARAEFGD